MSKRERQAFCLNGNLESPAVLCIQVHMHRDVSDPIFLLYNVPFSCSKVIKILCLTLHTKAFAALMEVKSFP